MAGRGRIREEDIATVRERASIEQVVSAYVTLKRSGSSLKGLCPFHDEKSGSFYVTPARNMFKCFGCAEGGDVITFKQKIDNLSFVDAVERLAADHHIPLRYEEGGPDAETRANLRSQRARLVEAHQVAQAFYAEHLFTDEAKEARRFLTERGFRREAAAMFSVGHSPNSWDALTKHLLTAGFTADEILTAGLASDGKRGPVDRFRGRLMWPIRDVTGDIVGFGARKILATDDGPKYLNTPETPIYKKSKVLFGLNLARKDIATRKKAVIVEGYTDVMACHLAGETTAIATCGTAFGEDHIRILRRLLDDTNGSTTGEVIYTFDGDPAGQKAALRAFELDDRFQTRTYVAVEPSGKDPCELRVAGGDEAVRSLIAGRVPLFEFAIRSILSRHDLDTAEGRVNALNAAAPIVATIRDLALRPEYERRLGRWLGMREETVTAAVGRAGSGHAPAPARPAPAPAEPDAGVEAPVPAGPPRPDPTDADLRMERETLRLLIQEPQVAIDGLSIVSAAEYAHPAYRDIYDAILAALRGGAHTGSAWVTAVQQHTTFDTVRDLITELAVEPAERYEANRFLPTIKVTEETLAQQAFYAVAMRGVERRIAEIQNALNAPGLTTEDAIRRSSEVARLIAHQQDLATRVAAL